MKDYSETCPVCGTPDTDDHEAYRVIDRRGNGILDTHDLEQARAQVGKWDYILDLHTGDTIK